MVEILQVDADALTKLGTSLEGHANTIGGIAHLASITMPGSALESVTTQVTQAVLAAYAAQGTNIRQMSTTALSGAKTYEQVDQAFADQFQKLNG
ncbi:UDP-glucose 4-epimerase [Nocardia sp. NPDC003693]